MKKLLPILLATVLSAATVTQAQTAPPYDEATTVKVQTFARVAEVQRIADLTPEQAQSYTAVCKQYYTAVYRAVHVEKHFETAAQAMRDAKKTFDNALMNILTTQQQTQYVRAMVKDEIHQETMVKIAALEKTGKFQKEMLNKAYGTIYNYYMTVKINNIRNQHDVEKREENFTLLKKVAPQIVKQSTKTKKTT